MSTRKLQVQGASPFLVAPSRPPQKEKTRKLTGELDWRLPGSKSPKGSTVHARKVSELPAMKGTIRKPQSRKTSKSPTGSQSPKSPFSDLNAMLQFLSRQSETKKPRSPYHTPKHHFSPTIRSNPSSKPRSPANAGSPRASFALQSRVMMQVEKGVVKSPKLYENQIFRDVFDPIGNHDKELYSSFADSSLEIYQETKGTRGSGITLVPKTLASSSQQKCFRSEKPENQDNGHAPDTTKVEEERDSPKKGKPEFGEELWRKLSQLQEARGDSETETACEEFRDSRKQGIPHHKS